jgi:hypothetical protein
MSGIITNFFGGKSENLAATKNTFHGLTNL